MSMCLGKPICATSTIKIQKLAAVAGYTRLSLVASKRALFLLARDCGSRTLLLRRLHGGRPGAVAGGMRLLPPPERTLRQWAARTSAFSTNTTSSSAAFRNHVASSTTTSTTNSNNYDYSISPVLIVGGGPTGLFLALLLARYNVPSIVMEQQSIERRFYHPQAHFLNTRTMEILRHALPDVYRAVQSAMIPVDEWRHFRFGGTSLGDPNAIVVRHAVDIPLQADRDANGVVTDHYLETTTTPRDDLSPVTVGHLAQHTFGKILFDAASRMAPTTTLLYGTEVIQLGSATARSDKSAINNNNDDDDATTTTTCDSYDDVWVHTRDGRTFHGSWCIGADGAHSWVRRQCGIPMHGTAALQHLMNIHVRRRRGRCNQSEQQSSDQPPPAMLYATFSPLSVAMTVRHNANEYIVQIPYFPPYQTPQVDFAPDKLVAIVGEIFGDADAWTIVSAQPWTMGSLVAERYVAANDNHRVLLMGDAAHVFPPAGGFGMNTGLQDAYNLAWKIAAASGRRRSIDLHHHHHHHHDVGTSYERERRPVAQSNAALSVRNYERLLKVTQSAYLDRRHPELLQYLLDRSPLPMSARQAIFRSLYQAALFPFRWLSQSPQGLYARHIRSNVRSALQSGTGLPLLFPAHEIGFSYHCNDNGNGRDSSSNKSSNDGNLAATKSGHSQTQWRQDTMPSPRTLAIGALVPHASVTVFLPGAEIVRHKQQEDAIITTVDLPAQVHNSESSLNGPTFVLFCWKPKLRDPHCLQEIGARLASRLELLVRLVVMSDVADDLASFEQFEQLEEDCAAVIRLLAGKVSAFSCIDPCAVLIRPDGHVAGMALLSNQEVDVDDTVVELSRFL